MRLLLALFPALLLATPALAESHLFDDAHATLEVPANWKVEEDPPMTLIDSPDDNAAALFFTIPNDQADHFKDVLEEQIVKKAPDVAWGKSKALKIHGMAATRLDGTGTLDGEPATMVKITVVRGDQTLFMFGSAAKKTPDLAKTLDGMLTSVKAAK